MTTLSIELDLPESLAKEAAQLGLLDPTALKDLLSEAVKARRVAGLIGARAKIAAAGIASLTLEEIEAEVRSTRRETRGTGLR